MKVVTTPEISKCNLVYLLRSVLTGAGFCIGFTKETPSGLPQGDVVHMCWLTNEGIEKSIETKRCYPNHRISCTVDEAEKIGVNFIRAAALQVEVKKDE